MIKDGIVRDEKNIYYYSKGKLHRPIEDGPAIIYASGRQEWYVDGEFIGMRKASGYEEWYKDGLLHKEGGPAIISPSGKQEWYINGKRHREDGPAIIYPSGRREWYQEGILHREDGPAIIYANDREEYYKNGKLVKSLKQIKDSEENKSLFEEFTIQEIVAAVQGDTKSVKKSEDNIIGKILKMRVFSNAKKKDNKIN